LFQFINNQFFKKVIIIFWSIWWLTIIWTDSVSVLSHLGYLTSPWAIDRYSSFVEILNIYSLPFWVDALLYLSIILWSILLTILFFFTALNLRKETFVWMKYAKISFILSMILWFMLILADQIIMKYDIENLHMIQGGFQLICFLSLYILSE